MTEAEILFAEVAAQADKAWDDTKMAQPTQRGDLPAGLRGIGQVRTIKLRKDDKENHRCSVEFVVRRHDELDEGGDYTNAVGFLGVSLRASEYNTLEEQLAKHTVLLVNLGCDVSATDGFADCSALYDDINTRLPFFKFHTFSMDDSDYVNISCDGPYTGDDIEATDTVDLESTGLLADTGDSEAQALLTDMAGAHDISPDDFPTWVELAAHIQGMQDTANEPATTDFTETGAAADAGDADAIASLTEIASVMGVDPDDYETWAALAALAAKAEDTSDDTIPTQTARVPSNIADLTALCEKADAGSAESETRLIELCTKQDINHNDYNTWVDVVADLFSALYPTAAEVAKEVDAEIAAGTTQSLPVLGNAADQGSGEAVNTLSDMATAADMDPDDYSTWLELANALESVEQPSFDWEVGSMAGAVLDDEGTIYTVEIMSIEGETCEVKCYDDNAIYGVDINSLVEDPNAA